VVSGIISHYEDKEKRRLVNYFLCVCMFLFLS
jgi:hypothetical protein